MIAKICETCERDGDCGISDCRDPEWSHHFTSRAALEAEIERLACRLCRERPKVEGRQWCVECEPCEMIPLEEALDAARKERDEARAEVARLEGVAEDLRCLVRVEQAKADMPVFDARGLHIEDRLAWTIRRVCAERDAARAKVARLDGDCDDWRAAAQVVCEADPARPPASSAILKAVVQGIRAANTKLRSERDTARAEVAGMRDEIARLESMFFSERARARELEARGFERPGPGAHTCGDALGLRRLPEIPPRFTAPDIDDEEAP